LEAQGSFTAESIAEFGERCIPSVLALYPRLPKIGERLASFSGIYPITMCTELVKLCVTIDAQATATDGSGEDEDDAADDDRSRRHDDYLDDDLPDPDDDDFLPPLSSSDDGDTDDLARLAEATSDADDDDHVARTASVATIRTATRRGVDGRTTA